MAKSWLLSWRLIIGRICLGGALRRMVIIVCTMILGLHRRWILVRYLISLVCTLRGRFCGMGRWIGLGSRLTLRILFGLFLGGAVLSVGPLCKRLVLRSQVRKITLLRRRLVGRGRVRFCGRGILRCLNRGITPLWVTLTFTVRALCRRRRIVLRLLLMRRLVRVMLTRIVLRCLFL